MAAYTTIDAPEAYFQVRAFTGNQGTLAVTLDGDTDMLPTMVWIKPRETASYGTIVWDSVRGVTDYIETNSNGVEGEGLSGVDSFDSDGFTLGSYRGANDSAGNIAWCWKESATAGFDIVLYTGSGSARTISHSLSAVPHLILVKNRDAADPFQVYHHGNTAAPETDYLVVDTDAATADAADRWNDTAPTSSVFSLGDGDEGNTNTEDYIAYCFAEKQGFSKFGTYVTTNNANGPFNWCGFRPAVLIVKFSSQTGPWIAVDNKRDPINQMDAMLRLDTAAAEVDQSGVDFDFLSNGFKVRGTSGWINEPAGSTISWIAFAESPFVNSKGVPNNAR